MNCQIIDHNCSTHIYCTLCISQHWCGIPVYVHMHVTFYNVATTNIYIYIFIHLQTLGFKYMYIKSSKVVFNCNICVFVIFWSWLNFLQKYISYYDEIKLVMMCLNMKNKHTSLLEIYVCLYNLVSSNLRSSIILSCSYQYYLKRLYSCVFSIKMWVNFKMSKSFFLFWQVNIKMNTWLDVNRLFS